MRATFSEIAGDKPGQKSGREVHASGCKAPLALISDAALRAGKVRDAQVKGGDISMGELRARIVASPARAESNTPARLLLEGANGPLLLFETPELSTVAYKLRWAGDLDADGGLDLVIEEEDDGVRVYLFLSRDKPVNGSGLPQPSPFTAAARAPLTTGPRRAVLAAPPQQPRPVRETMTGRQSIFRARSLTRSS